MLLFIFTAKIREANEIPQTFFLQREQNYYCFTFQIFSFASSSASWKFYRETHAYLLPNSNKSHLKLHVVILHEHKVRKLIMMN